MKNKQFKELLKGSEETYLLATQNGCVAAGNTPKIMSLLACTIRSLRKDINDEMLKHACDLAFKTDEEINKLTLEAMKNMLDILGGTNE